MLLHELLQIEKPYGALDLVSVIFSLDIERRAEEAYYRLLDCVLLRISKIIVFKTRRACLFRSQKYTEFQDQCQRHCYF